MDAIEAELEPWATRPQLADAVARLGGYRGIAQLTGLTLAAEVTDWRRFPSACALMGFTGLVPAEYSSGERTRRGSITKAGSVPARSALIEAAWAYRHKPAIGLTLRRRQHDGRDRRRRDRPARCDPGSRGRHLHEPAHGTPGWRTPRRCCAGSEVVKLEQIKMWGK